MKKKQARKIVSRLNGNAYLRYIHGLFSIWYGDNKQPTSFSKFPRSNNFDISPDIFQVFQNDPGPPMGVFHLYNIYIPHQFPLDLFQNPKNINIENPYLKGELKKISKRYLQFSRDIFIDNDQVLNAGDVITAIYILTNFCEIPKDDYFDYILPKYERLIYKMGFKDINIGIGSPDSFFDKDSRTAKKVLENFLSTNSDGICINLPIKGHFTVSNFSYEKYLHSGVTKKFKLPSELVYVKLIKHKEAVIQEFEDILVKNPTERKLELFLKENFKVIFGPYYDRIETQIWLRFPELEPYNKDRRLDIFIRNCITSDWELIELKRPIKIVRTYRDLPVFSNEIYNAIQQIRHYKRLLTQDKVRKHFASEGIEYFEPELKIVIGRKPQISQQDWRWLIKSNENDVKIITYDDLITEMRLRLKDLRELL